MNISPSGENKFLVRGFKNRQKLMNHWHEHGNKYPNFTVQDYENRAIQLIESAVNENILGHTDRTGAIIRYDKTTNDFVKGRPIKGIFTMFKPEEGILYYETRKKEDIEHGGAE